MIFDPLAEKWVSPRIADHLRPSVAGHQWIANRLEQELRL